MYVYVDDMCSEVASERAVGMEHMSVWRVDIARSSWILIYNGWCIRASFIGLLPCRANWFSVGGLDQI